MKSKILILISFLMLLSVDVYARMTVIGVAGVVSEAPVSENNVIFYFNCDASTASQSPQVGSGTVTVGGGMTTIAGQVSNALDNNDDTYGGGSVTIPYANFNAQGAGTLGFWLYLNNTDEAPVVALSGYSGGDSDFRLYTWSNNLYWNYRGSDLAKETVGTGSWIFVELAWDNANGDAAIRVNNGTWTEDTNVTGTAPPTNENLLLPAVDDGNVVDALIDQIIISDVYKDDLYAIRNSTTF